MKGYKTLLFAIILAVLGAIETFQWAELIPAEYVGIFITAVGFIVGILRKFTTTALGQKE